jgi:hypothetical protein
MIHFGRIILNVPQAMRDHDSLPPPVETVSQKPFPYFPESAIRVAMTYHTGM